MKKQPLKYTCIYGGGAIRGISYVGAIKALEEENIEVSTLAGSSVGALFAGLLAVGYSCEELTEIFMGVSFDLFRDLHFGFGKEFALSKGEVYLDWVRELIEKKFYGEKYKKGENIAVTFKDLDKNLVIITTDLTNFKYKEFSKFETPDFEIASAIRISSSMPGLMPPYKYNNAKLVDGDLQKSWPLWKLSKNLYPENERILEFRLEGDYNPKGKNPIDFVNTVYSCVTSMATEFIIDAYAQKDKFDYIKINTGEVIIVDFNQPTEKRQNLIDIGYKQTKSYFKSYLPEKKATLLKDYELILKHLKKIHSYLTPNTISKAQIELGKLFINLCELKNIDSSIYDKIKSFEVEFSKELNRPNIFGNYPRENVSKISNLLPPIIDLLKEKTNELNKYILLSKL